MKTNTKHWASITAGILSLAGYASATSFGSEKYIYDASGNIVEKLIDGRVTKMTYDASNNLQLVQSAGNQAEPLDYDLQGLPVSHLNKDGLSSQQLEYGYLDKVIKTQVKNSETEFFYNSEGQLVGKNTSASISSYAWDGNVLASDGTETFVNENHISGGVPILVSGKNVVVSDYLANTLSDGERKFQSSAYGEGLEEARFTGKMFVRELGGFVFTYRNYSPYSCCWTIEDPSGYPDGLNNLSYVSSNLLTSVDPLGLNANPWVIHDQNNNVKPQATWGPTYVHPNRLKGKINYWKGTAPQLDQGVSQGSTPNIAITNATTTTLTGGVSGTFYSVVTVVASSATAITTSFSLNIPLPIPADPQFVYDWRIRSFDESFKNEIEKDYSGTWLYYDTEPSATQAGATNQLMWNIEKRER